VSRLDFRLPDVGEGLSEAEIVTWRVAEGDRVREDDILAEVETDKSVVEVPAPHDGIVVALGGVPGDVIPVGGLLAVLEVDSGHPTLRAAAEPTAAHTRVAASPATRRRAVELGVHLAAVAATGPGGRVLMSDVESAAAAPAPAAPPTAAPPTAAPPPPPPAAAPPDRAPDGAGEDRVEPLRGVRRRIAQTMAQTLQIPAITEWRDVDATRLLDVHGRLRERAAARHERLTLLPLVLQAAAAALREHPRFNARIDVERQEITYLQHVNLGVATATPDGLIVPVVRDADRLRLRELAAEVERLAEAARTRTLAVEDTANGTFTVTNFGSFGTVRGAPLIRPPEVAIAGIGRVHDAVVAVDGRPQVRPVLPLVVSTDHRLNDGDHLAAFCASFAAYLSDPTLLL
jgi:pyruvate dehydrogenase E2 component (dihydrolipoamide acetyltransferase)